MLVLLGIMTGAIIAFLFPEAILWMKPGLKPAFAVTMFFVSTLIRPDQLQEFAKAPLRPFAGLIAQYTIMPLLAFAVSFLFSDPIIRTGIILVGCMPGAMASNVMSVLLKGDLILSVSMTTLAALLCPLILATWLPLLTNTAMEVPVGKMVIDTSWMICLPVLAGITVRWFHPSLPRRWDSIATSTASLAIVVIVLVVVAANRNTLASRAAGILFCMLFLNLSGYLLAWLFARMSHWPPHQQRTLIIEVGMQNAGLGSVLAMKHLGETGAIPSAFYTVICLLTVAAALPIQQRLSHSKADPS